MRTRVGKDLYVKKDRNVGVDRDRFCEFLHKSSIGWRVIVTLVGIFNILVPVSRGNFVFYLVRTF